MPTIEDDIHELRNTRSPKRRAAAKRLRKRGDVSAGPALLAALRQELEDTRTWETQYQMIMAIGECGYADAIPFLEELVLRDFDATMVYMALGDALVRLKTQGLDDGGPVIEHLDSGNALLIEGALRAMAMLKMRPGSDHVGKLLDYAARFTGDSWDVIWLLAAAAGWSGAEVDAFVARHEKSARREVREAAALARAKKYRTWHPL